MLSGFSLTQSQLLRLFGEKQVEGRVSLFLPLSPFFPLSVPPFQKEGKQAGTKQGSYSYKILVLTVVRVALFQLDSVTTSTFTNFALGFPLYKQKCPKTLYKAKTATRLNYCISCKRVKSRDLGI